MLRRRPTIPILYAGAMPDEADVIDRQWADGTTYRGADVHWWTGEDDNGLACYCGLDMYPDGSGFLCRSWVRDDLRGHGLQRRMIRIRERFGRTRCGMYRCVTYTAPGNNASANSLIACGYRLYTPDHEYGCEGANYWCKAWNPDGTARKRGGWWRRVEGTI